MALGLVPLPEAAMRLKMPYSRAYTALLEGRLQGERRGSRWLVTETSVDQLQRQLTKAPVPRIRAGSTR